MNSRLSMSFPFANRSASLGQGIAAAAQFGRFLHWRNYGAKAARYSIVGWMAEPNTLLSRLPDPCQAAIERRFCVTKHSSRWEPLDALPAISMFVSGWRLSTNATSKRRLITTWRFRLRNTGGFGPAGKDRGCHLP